MSYNHLAKIQLKKSDQYDQLSFEQKIIFELAVFQHKNLFITGQAGSGKSHLLRTIISAMRAVYKQNESEKVVVTSMTGVAALNINGATLHSAIGLNSYNVNDDDLNDPKSLQKKLFRQSMPQVNIRIQEMDILIIDEVSMLSSYVLDAMDVHFRKIRNKQDKLFGGIQLILCGDFMQLPPVEKLTKQKLFLFKSQAFQKIEFKIQLIQQFRQLHDNHFNNILLKIRNNQIDQQVKNALASRIKDESQLNKEQDEERVRARNLFYQKIRKYDEQYNYFFNKMKSYAYKVKEFKKQNDVSNLNQHIQNIRNMCKYCRRTYETVKQLKSEQMVEPQFPTRLYSTNDKAKEYNEKMLMKNKKRLIYIIKSEDYNNIKNSDNDKMFQVESQIRLAEGVQVMVCKNIDVRSNIVNGSVGYVEKVFYSNDVKEYKYGDMRYVELDAIKNNVQVIVNIYEGGVQVNKQQQIRRITIKATKFEIKGNNDKVQASRQQIPLTLAYALTIHKSQGITLNRAVIDLSNPFSDGIVYVALSRLKSLDGLTLLKINYEKIHISQDCVDFYNDIDKIEMKDISVTQKLNRIWKTQAENQLHQDIDTTVLCDDVKEILEQRNIQCNITPLVSKSQRFQINMQQSQDIIISVPKSQTLNYQTQLQTQNQPQQKKKVTSASNITQNPPKASRNQRQAQLVLSQHASPSQPQQQQSIDPPQESLPDNKFQQNQTQNIVINKSIDVISITSTTEEISSKSDDVQIQSTQQIENRTASTSPATARTLNEQRYYEALLRNIGKNQ